MQLSLDILMLKIFPALQTKSHTLECLQCGFRDAQASLDDLSLVIEGEARGLEGVESALKDI